MTQTVYQDYLYLLGKIMVISKKGLKKLGKSLRNEVQASSSESIKVLKNYRRTFDPFLISAGNALNLKANESNIPFILSGRLKRVKSIVRKLVREPTMDLSRMSDIIGLRIIVENLNDQKSILKYIYPCGVICMCYFGFIF